jgi:hypothetical protein
MFTTSWGKWNPEDMKTFTKMILKLFQSMDQKNSCENPKD